MEFKVTSLARTALAESIVDLRVVEASDVAGDVSFLNLSLFRREGRTSSGAGSGVCFRGAGVSPTRWDSNPGGVSLKSVLLRGLSQRGTRGATGRLGL